MTNVTHLPKTKRVALGKLELQCRLDGRAIVQIEKRLKQSLTGLFIKGEGELRLPPTNELLLILHATNTSHGIKETDLLNAFYDHVDSGGDPSSIMDPVQELLEEAGFFGRSNDKEEEEPEVTLDNDQEEDGVL